MDKQLLFTELSFKAVRSGGAGGQHVNKVSTKIELTFHVENSNGLTYFEKQRLYRSIPNKISKEHLLSLQCDESRSQHQNKETAIKRFFKTLENGLKVKKVRRKTKPTRSSVQKRLDSKKSHSQKKLNRKKPES
jgi:ribosome-associated protein